MAKKYLLTLAVMCVLLVAFPNRAAADPVVYDFTGYFSSSANAVTGKFTIDNGEVTSFSFDFSNVASAVGLTVPLSPSGNAYLLDSSNSLAYVNPIYYPSGKIALLFYDYYGSNIYGTNTTALSLVFDSLPGPLYIQPSWSYLEQPYPYAPSRYVVFNFSSGSATLAPEPSTLLLTATGLFAGGFWRRSRSR